MITNSACRVILGEKEVQNGECTVAEGDVQEALQSYDGSVDYLKLERL